MTRDPYANFDEMAVRVHEEGTLEETLDRVLEFALSAMQCRHAAVALKQGGMLVTVAATDPVVEGLPELETKVGAGPDLDMLADRLGVLVTDTATETRWPQWSGHLAASGIRGVLGARLFTATETMGTLTMYDPSPGRFVVDDQAVAQILARHTAAALVKSRTAKNLWHAIDSRKRIGQAQGILMERFDLTEEQSFQVLIRWSQTENRKLREVADDVVRRRDRVTRP